LHAVAAPSPHGCPGRWPHHARARSQESGEKKAGPDSSVSDPPGITPARRRARAVRGGLTAFLASQLAVAATLERGVEHPAVVAGVVGLFVYTTAWLVCVGELPMPGGTDGR
jgi:hypothetical protein